MRILALVLSVVSCSWLPGAVPARAQAVAASPDIHIDVGGTLVVPGAVAEDLIGVPPVGIDLGPLPGETDVTAYAPLPGVGELFAIGHTQELAGGIVARPVDVVLWDGASYAIALAGSGTFPDGTRIDAIEFVPAGSNVWLSLDTTSEIAGAVFRDADVFDDTLSLVFDATAAGVPDGLDVDAVSAIQGSGELLLSFDVGGTLGGVTFADEDVLRYDPIADTWTLEVDTSAQLPEWEAADLDAMHFVPEPGRLGGVMAGLAFLALARPQRSRTR